LKEKEEKAAAVHKQKSIMSKRAFVSIDYRCDNGHFRLSARDCQIPANLNLSKPRSKTENLDF
jgi:hypothetical protein